MFTFRFDKDNATLVWLFSGRTNSDDDFARYVESIGVFDRMAADWDAPAAFLHVDAENPRPTALWRQRMAEATIVLRSKPFFSLSSASAVIRAVVTAVNWLRPPPFVFSTHATFEDSCAWMAQRTGRSMTHAPALLAGAREDAVHHLATSIKDAV